MKRLFNKLIITLISMSFYMLFTGIATELTILTGFMISIAISLVFDGFLIRGEIRPKDMVKVVYLLKYILLFIVVELKEHLKIAKIVLKGDSSVNPEVVVIPLDLETDYGISLLALTITNTPGTIAIHIDKTKKSLYVHWLTAKAGDTTEIKRELVGGFEDLAKKIFG